MIVYKFPNVKVAEVKEIRPLLRGYKDGADDIMVYGSGKWYVHFEGSMESLCFGVNKPDLEVGDVVDLIVRKR